MFRSDGRTALVTGASQGIGRAIALRLAEHGARVIAAARSVDKLASLAAEIAAAGGEALPLALDLARPETVAERFAELPAEWQSVDILVNNAGITRDQLFARMKLDDWNAVLTTNLTGGYATTRELVRGMMRQRWGRVIFVSSVVGLMGNAGQANYAASKAGVIGLARSLARELASRNITVNVVAPGFVATAMTEAIDEKSREKLAEGILLKRFGTPDDVAAAVVYLASDAAGYMTGEVLNLSGGLFIG